MAAGRLHIGRLVVVGCLVAVVSEVAKLLVASLKFGPIATSLAAVAAAGLIAGLDVLKEPASRSASVPYQHHQPGAYAGRRPGGSTGSGARNVLIAVVVLAVLGAGAYGAAWSFRYVTGTETGVERMAEPPAQGTAGPLIVTVRGVEVTPHYIKITLRAVNTADNPVTIAVNEQWCRLVGSDGDSLPPYGGFTGLGSGNIEVPANGIQVSEVLTFKGQPSGEGLTLSFSTLFTRTPGANSLQITDIRLTPPPA